MEHDASMSFRILQDVAGAVIFGFRWVGGTPGILAPFVSRWAAVCGIEGDRHNDRSSRVLKSRQVQIVITICSVVVIAKRTEG